MDNATMPTAEEARRHKNAPCHKLALYLANNIHWALRNGLNSAFTVVDVTDQAEDSSWGGRTLYGNDTLNELELWLVDLGYSVTIKESAKRIGLDPPTYKIMVEW